MIGLILLGLGLVLAVPAIMVGIQPSNKVDMLYD
jgi:hypothetical protein